MSSASIGSGSHAERRLLHQRVPPVVAALLHRHGHRPLGVGPPRRTTTTFSIDGASVERFVGDLLERNDLSAAISAVGGDEEPAPSRR